MTQLDQTPEKTTDPDRAAILALIDRLSAAW